MATLTALMMASNSSGMPDSMKFWDCGLGETTIGALLQGMDYESKFFFIKENQFKNFFFYYNPIKESKIWAGFFEKQRKLQRITLNNCDLQDNDVSLILEEILKEGHENLIYLDFTENLLTNEGKLF